MLNPRPTPTDITVAEAWETYVVTEPVNPVFGRHVGTVTDALTGRQTAQLRGSGGRVYHIVLNEPLCMNCDAPVSDWPCGCVEVAA